MEGRFRSACPAWVGIQIPTRSAGESMAAAGHGAAQPAAAGWGLIMTVGDYPPASKRIILQTHVQAGVTAIKVIFKPLGESTLWRLTGEQHKPYGLLCVQYVPGKGNLAPVSCLPASERLLD